MEKEEKVRFPIGAKLILIISILVVLSLGAITTLVSYFVSSDVRITAEENNHTVNTRSASAAENELSVIRSNVFLLLDLLNVTGSSGVLSRQASTFFFERNQTVASILIVSENGMVNPNSGDLRLINSRFFSANELDSEIVDTYLSNIIEQINKSCNGETIVLNASPYFNSPALALLYPWREGGRNQSVVIIFSGENLTETFGTGTMNTSFMVNDSGDVLIHPEFDVVQSGANFSNMPLVQEMRKNNDNNRQITFTDNDIQYFGAYQKLKIGDIGVLTIVPSDTVFETVRTTTKRNIYLTMAVLFLSVLFIWFYAKTISHPLRRLTGAASKIKDGEFNIKFDKRSNDELGILTNSFEDMGKALVTFSRFTNMEVAKLAIAGKIAIGGENKNCTIFFSDIRGFTAISDKLSPEEVVAFLNVYMERMVSCVVQEGGTVDKFEGDAVMAIWGAPIDKAPQENALHCVRSALRMRKSLQEFNVGRGGDKNPIIKIGCGINSGPVIAGQIGSTQKMEYTVIGDTVNFASRTEALNKPLGSDILITENTWELIKDEVLVEEMPSVTVKGKEGKCRMFAVINMLNATDIPGCGPTGPKSMQEVRAMLGIPTPDYAKVNLDEEEKKYNIQG